MSRPNEGIPPYLQKSVVALPPPVCFHAFFSSCAAILFTGLLVNFAVDGCFVMLIFSGWNWKHEGETSIGASSMGFLFITLWYM